jgi:2-iminobutanoate/2-iminopropanoate deaminase
VKHAVEGTRPSGAYSPGIVSEGRYVHVSGQGPLRDGTVVPGTIEEETRLTLDNLGKVLAAAGAGFGDVVRCGVHLADIADFDAMNAVYDEYFEHPKPARTTVGSQLGGGIKVEIDCVAVLAS